ncbi:MAG: riboflavin biosynthesis protein RibF [Acidimicrobiia bacterium]
MKVYSGDPATWTSPAAGSAVAIGVFDGVHRGHRAVFDALASGDEGLQLTAMTFSTHPDGVVSGSPAPPALTTLERRLELFDEAGLDATAIIDFDVDVMRLSPEAFVDRFLVDSLNAKTVAVGDGFRFGYEAVGTVDTLRLLGQSRGFSLVSTPILTIHGTQVRSSSIRAAVASGGVALAARMLGRPFAVDGVVVSGDGRGSTIGVPTANVEVPDGFVRPAGGVYAVVATVDGIDYNGVCNVGVRPTFGGGAETIEVHILGHDLQLTGKTVHVAFVERIRSEQRFDSVNELVSQIAVDIERAEQVFATQEG